MDAARFSSIQASVSTGPRAFLRLLLARELCDLDPAPEFPAVPPPPAEVTARLGRVSSNVTEPWREHWAAAVAQLGATAPPVSGAWAAWPAPLPEPTDADIAGWGITVSRPPRGTPLEQHPGRRYWRARTHAPDILPERVIVLPFVGHYAGRFGSAVGYLSTEAYRNPIDDRYGFAPVG